MRSAAPVTAHGALVLAGSFGCLGGERRNGQVVRRVTLRSITGMGSSYVRRRLRMQFKIYRFASRRLHGSIRCGQFRPAQILIASHVGAASVAGVSVGSRRQYRYLRIDRFLRLCHGSRLPTEARQ